ncbi:hypothetical protein [Burkholderia seminalis]|uniref:hypothetical protein n=1 Tax=Burkholderia seminalis TaxID=488731 RepID=UPI0015889A7E|nr:hypothetical protein [Burkholderia seminalis]
MSVAIASGVHAAADASPGPHTARNGNPCVMSYRSMKSFDIRNRCGPERDVFTQRALCGAAPMRYAVPHIDFAKRW